jgi:formimidoylglutamate deiminase
MPRKLKFASALLPTGWAENVVIEVDAAGMIVSIATDSRKDGADGAVAVAAMANVHSHAHQRLMAGLAERAGPGADSFWTWRETMYDFALRLGPEDLEAAAAQLYVEMLKAGYSAVGEFQYLHHQPDGSPYAEPAELSLRCLAAAEHAGIALTLLPTLYTFGGFGEQPAQPGQRRFVNDAPGFLRIVEALTRPIRQRPLCRLGISPHSLRAVSGPLVNEVMAELDRIDRKAPIHIHVAEQLKEVDDCVAWSIRRPVELLLDRFDVSPRWCAIHATHMSPEETQRLARSGAAAGLCSTTEANLGDGIFNAEPYMRDRGAIAIGSDSHVCVSVAEELRQLEYSQRLRMRARNVLAGGPGRSTGRNLFDAAAKGGAAALDQPVGELAVGRRADIVALDPEHPALLGRTGDELLDSWIFSGGNSCVKDVFVAGERIVKDRRHVREAAIAGKFRATIERLRAA